MEWYERLKQARLNAGLSQADCAHKMGFTVAAWQAYERGRRVPSILQANALCKILGISLDWLMNG